MHIIYLIYGLSFLALGIAILLQSRKSDRFELCSIIWLLAAFGILHGILEWLELWTMIAAPNPYLNLFKPVLLLISYTLLFEFGRRFILQTLQASPASALVNVRIYLPLSAGLLLTLFLSDNYAASITLWSRYLPAFAGSMLTGIGFLRYYQFRIQPALTQKSPLSLKYASYAAALSFMAYAVFGGLIVPYAAWFPANWLNQESFLAATGIPVQILRTGCALLSTVSVMHIIFELRILELQIRQP